MSTVEDPCKCEFEYHYRWPQFYDALLSNDPEKVGHTLELLEDRDRALELHLFQRCDNGGGFDYPTRWAYVAEGFLSGDDRKVHDATTLLDERDTALETHIAGRPCFGTNIAAGITCTFDYPTRWPQLAPMLLSGDREPVRTAVGLLHVRDIDLETHLTNRVCTPHS